MKIKNKELLQSHVLSTAQYQFSIYEKRILYFIIYNLQSLLKGQKLQGQLNINQNIFGNYEITMPISAILQGENDKNHAQIKKALYDLENKRMIYDDDKEWEVLRVIQMPKILKYESIVTFTLQPKIYEVFLNFAKGFSKYRFQIAMNLKSIYAMRIYELIGGQKKNITYSIEHLKEMFKIQDKYRLTTDFIKRVIDVAQKELDKNSDVSFEYKTNKTGRKITSITFHPITIPENVDEELKQKKLSQSFLDANLNTQEQHRLSTTPFNFTQKELNNNLDTFRLAKMSGVNLLSFLQNIEKKVATQANNPQGYVIQSLKNEITTIKLDKKITQQKRLQNKDNSLTSEAHAIMNYLMGEPINFTLEEIEKNKGLFLNINRIGLDIPAFISCIKYNISISKEPKQYIIRELNKKLAELKQRRK